MAMRRTAFSCRRCRAAPRGDTQTQPAAARRCLGLLLLGGWSLGLRTAKRAGLAQRRGAVHLKAWMSSGPILISLMGVQTGSGQPILLQRPR